MQERPSLRKLVEIMDRLRDPGGCPWDREQSYETLRGYLVEECYEVAEAIDRQRPDELREELGDLLFQIVFLARLGKESGEFTIEDVIEGITDKMTRRHPHVFGSARAESSEEVLANWEAIKREEKPATPGRSILDGVPRALPALLKAQRLGTKAARVGFDWNGARPVLDKVREEAAELEHAVEAGDRDASAEELGDLLFTLAMLARHLDVDAEAVLERSNAKFVERFRWIEAELDRTNRSFEGETASDLEALWQRAKLARRTGPQTTSKTPNRRNRS